MWNMRIPPVEIFIFSNIKTFLSELMEEKSAEPVMDGVTFYVK